MSAAAAASDFNFQNHPASRLDRGELRQGGLLKSKLRLLVRPGLTGGRSGIRKAGEEFSLHLLVACCSSFSCA